MRAVIQRVNEASVEIEGKLYSSCKKGLLILLGVGEDDTDEDLNYIAEKCANLRIFEDEKRKMNLSVLDVKGDILVVSQFTLFADTRKGRRPSFIKAAKPHKAIPLYEKFVSKMESFGLAVKSGVFGAMMDIKLINAGPVTIMIDSAEK